MCWQGFTLASHSPSRQDPDFCVLHPPVSDLDKWGAAKMQTRMRTVSQRGGASPALVCPLTFVY